MQTLWAPTGHIGYGSSWDSYEDFPFIDITNRAFQRASINRGRQYEINQQQSGTWIGSWINTDGAFDPANTSSVYAPDVLPYRGFRLRGQWPNTGVNLLTVDQATSGEGTPFGAGADPSIFGIDYNAAVITEWLVVASATAFQGTQVCEITYAAAVATGQLSFYTRFAVTPLQPYSFTIHARSVLTGKNPSAQAQVVWQGPTGATLSTINGSSATLTGSPSAGWTTLTVSGTAPAGAAIAVMGLNYPSGTVSGVQVQADGLQFENSLTPSAFAVPNPWYDVFTGGVEQYPQSWTMSGTFGKVAPTATDTFALLSQSLLADPLTSAIFTPSGGAGPTFAYLLGDPGGNGLFADTVGQRSPATENNSKAGGGTITPGTAQTAATVPGGLFMGAPGATVTNITSATAAGTATPGLPMSWIGIPPNNSGVTGPAGGTGLGWMRMIAFRCTALPAATSALWITQDNPGTDKIYISLQASGNVVVAVNDAGHAGSAIVGTFDIGNWHLAWLGVAADGSSTTTGVDGSVATFGAGGSGNFVFTGGFVSDQIGCSPITNDPRNGLFNLQGDVAFAVEWPFVLSGAQVAAIYGAWKTAFSGDSSGQRYARILQWAGWTGPTAIDSGSSTSLGPATDIVGLDAFSCLQAVVDTEAGNHFVDSTGRLTFKSRAARYNSTSPVVVFGEGLPAGNAGEIPVEDISFGCDPTLLCNLAQVTQTTTQQVFTGRNASSQSQFGTRIRQITNQSTLSQECQDQANYVDFRYMTPIQRVASMTVHPAAMPASWGTILGIEQAQRVRAIKRPVGAPPIVFDGFVENIAHAIDTSDTTGPDWTVTFQLSPVDPTPYAVFAALHTTLHAQANSGVTSITLNPLADSATNPAAGQLYIGQKITLGPGTAASQTVTITSVATTTAGYASVAVGITPAASSTFALGVTVCEALPALSSTTYTNAGLSYTPPGPTNPAQWDSTVFGAANFAY
jgi:hypothetical protein